MTQLSTNNKQDHTDLSEDLSFQDKSVLKLFSQNVFSLNGQSERDSGKDNSEKSAQDILEWAIKNKIQHISFLCFPYNSTMCEKQQSLIDLRYYYKKGLKMETRLLLNRQLLQKGETDGSSFPSGGLRQTHRARAYMVRDPLSEIFIRKKNKIMYVPSLLVTHHGLALDDKTIFRKTEAVMKSSALSLLRALGKNAKDIFLALGLQQEFFVVPKPAYQKRPDLIFTGRTLVGRVGAKNQQFSDHYFAKIPSEIEAVLKEVEREFLQIGIPFKTRHNEVANNQFQYACVFTDAGKAIDQNLFAMEILKELFDKKGYTALLHEKPFLGLNGSGKHANWSINYVDEDSKLKNLFSVPKEEEDVPFFRLFILLTLSAIKKNNPLYFAAIAKPGNQIRLGGHQAPPRIISAYLGQTVSAVVDGKPAPARKNLKSQLFFLDQDIFQEDTDRNRTSPFAYTGHKFEFRALGSSQNAAWPMSVICATLAKEFIQASRKIKQGYTINTLINQLLLQTQGVRFQDDGYKSQWKQQAKSRGLYVNESFCELYQRLPKQAEVFVEIGACSQAEIESKCEVMKDEYFKTVIAEGKALLGLSYQKIIPRAFSYLQVLEKSAKSGKKFILSYSERITEKMNECLESLEQLEEMIEGCLSYAQAAELRKKIIVIGQLQSDLCSFLKKDQDFPDIEDFLLK